MFLCFDYIDHDEVMLSQEALTYAVQTQSTHMATWALFFGANPNYKGPFFKELSSPTLLIHAITNWDPAMIKLLVSYGADVDYTSKTSNIPLAEYIGQAGIDKICQTQTIFLPTCREDAVFYEEACCPKDTAPASELAVETTGSKQDF